VEDYPNTSSVNSRINLARNTPIAFVVGVAGFLGSYVAETLLKKGIQVIGIDDLSSGKMENLNALTRNKHFHFLNTSISEPLFASTTLAALSLHRLDYAFFLADVEESKSRELMETGVLNFLYFVQKHSKTNDLKKDKIKKALNTETSKITKIVLASSILLYNDELAVKEQKLREAEILFARFCKEEKLNARVVRMTTLFGPRMHFRENDPLVKIIYSAAKGALEENSIGVNFVTQAVYVEDAAELLVKSVLVGSTTNKIYDCLRPHPVYVSELKQLLMDPLWFEEKGFKPTRLPEWLSPNLAKTVKELSWNPTTNFHDALQATIKYFNNHELAEKYEEKKPTIGRLSNWSFNNPLFDQPKEEINVNTAVPSQLQEGEEYEEYEEELPLKTTRIWRSRIQFVLISGLIIIGLIIPIFQLALGALSIRYNLGESSIAIERGDFNEAFRRVRLAGEGIGEARKLAASLAIVERLGLFQKQIGEIDRVLSVIDEGVEGMNHAVSGTQALFETTKVIAGDSSATEDPKFLYEKAQIELTEAQKKLQSVQTALADDSMSRSLPGFLESRVEDIQLRVVGYSELVEKARAASFLLPSLTAIDGKKSYLILLQNNLELRAGGGFIGSYAKITFEKGKVVDVKVDDVYALDGGLADVIEPPLELKSDLNQNRWYMRDSNTEPDFPTSAKQAELFYKRTSGEVVSGVIAVNLSASAKLIDAVGGVDLPEYGESVNGSNLFEKTVNKAEAGFFPGSQAKKNYLTALQTQLFNKIFYLSKQNWPAIIRAVGESLEQKQMMVYLSDPALFSYALSENWGGLMPRGSAPVEGVTQDFLSLVEANMGANKANYFLDRRLKLETTIAKEGEIVEKLTVNYKNGSPANVFPGGTYRNRFKLYLPLGTKLVKFNYGETDLTAKVASFTDYGRTGYSILLELLPGEQKSVVIEYALNTPLTFKDGKAIYRLDILKQSGMLSDKLEWKLSYPLNMYIVDKNSDSIKQNQQEIFGTDLSVDRAFQLTFEKR